MVTISFAVHAQAQTQAITDYSENYVDNAGDNAALFAGRIQGQLAGNIESLYLRDRNNIEHDKFGGEAFPSPVSPLESYAMGDLFYDGVLYVGVRMRLDLYRDELVVAAPGNSFWGSVLSAERFGWADLRGYRIIHISERTYEGDLPEGYYLLLNDGRHEILKKETFQFNPLRREFADRRVRYYISKDGIYHSVGRRRGPVIRLFAEHGGELKRFIRTRRLSVRHDTDNALAEIVKEYERLTDR